MSKAWYVYIIESSDGRLYTGITTNVARRWQEHHDGPNGKSKGAKFFAGRKPKLLHYVEELNDRSSASKREYAIKTLKRTDKLVLFTSACNRAADFALELTN